MAFSFVRRAAFVSAARGLVACASLAAVACSGSDPSPGAGGHPGGSLPSSQDAGSTQDPGSTSHPPVIDGGADTGSTTVTPPAFVSNTPGATVVDVGTPPTPNLALASVNFLQKTSGTQVFDEWLGEVKNVGSSTECYVTLQLTYKDASGAVISTMALTYADADPYSAPGTTLTSPCLAPGKTGGFYQNGFVSAMAPISGTKTIEAKLASHQYPTDVPAPHTPTATAQITSRLGGYGLSGTFTGGSGAVYSIGYRAYPRDASGLVLGQLSATDLDTLSPGGTFAFSTQVVSDPFSQYRAFFQFIDGAKPAGALVRHDEASPFAREVALLDADRRAQQDATTARADLAR